jgi:ligand-binding sensor domain-containing protein/signal transduction histidine kinase
LHPCLETDESLDPKRYRVPLFCLVVWALHATQVFALDPARGLTQYVHDTWSVQDGLPQNAAYTVAQDGEGYLWVAQRQGLVRFDGHTFTPFPFGVSSRRETPAIHALHASGKGLWVGTGSPGVVYRIEKGRIAREQALPGDAPPQVQALREDRAGTLWIGTYNGLFALRGDAITDETDRLSLPSRDVGAILESHRGALWIGTAKGLTRVEGGTSTTYSVAEGLGGSHVGALLEDHHGTLWIGGHESDLTRLAEGAFTVFKVKEGPMPATIHALAEDGDGNVWVGTRRGLVRFRDGRFVSRPAPPGLARDHVRGLCVDREGSLWVATEERRPLHRLRDSPVVMYGAVEGVPSERVRSLVVDSADAFWMGTEDGLFRWDERGGTTFRDVRQDCHFEPRITSVLRHSRGDLWFAGAGRVFRLRPGRREPEAVDLRPHLGCHVMGSMVEDARGAVWVASRGSGLFKLEGGKLAARYTRRDGLPDDILFSLHSSRDGTLWAGATTGLARRVGDRWERVLPQNRGRALAFHEDADGTFWVGYNSKGLWRLRGGRWTRYGVEEGLPSHSVFGLMEDGAERLWILCEKGIYRVAKSDLDRIAESGGRIAAPRLFGETDGLPLPSDGIRHPGTARTSDGRLWFATSAGLAMLDPKRLRASRVPPAVRVERVVRNGQSVDVRQNGDFPAGAANYEFAYSSLLTAGPIRFRYKLDGFDPDWTEAGTRRVAYYTQLPPGQYTFRVTAGNDNGVWNDEHSTFKFRQRPFFHQTRWFYAASALGLVLAGAGTGLLRHRRQAREQRRLERLVDARTQDLRDANQKLDHANRELADTNNSLERRIAEGIAALREAERMGAYGQMVAAVAHEVRHPIFALQAAAYVIRDLMADRADLRSPLRTLQTQTERLDVLMKTLVDFAKPDALHLAPANVADVVDEALEMFFAERKGGPPVKVQLPELLPAVYVDRFRVGQAILNLLHNATQHARGLTAITVTARVIPGPGAPVVRVSVSDDGAGIPPAELPRIFDPFVTGGSGAGLGLAIVQRIARAHAGEVRVESEPGVGTAFHLDFPLNSPYS